MEFLRSLACADEVTDTVERQMIQQKGETPQVFMRGRVGIYLRKGGRMVGGLLARKLDDHYTISWAGTDRTVARNIQFFLIQELM